MKSHYSTIEQVIGHIVENKLHGHSLEETASSLGMSPGRLQKVFTEWVGITPKQFGRYLSLQYSKELLLQNKNSLQTAAGAGLSSGSRLHDLFVDIEAMTPGEYQNLGKELVINYSTFETGFGLCLVASTPRGVCNVLFADNTEDAVADLKSRWSKASVVKANDPIHDQIRKYFDRVFSHDMRHDTDADAGSGSGAKPKIKFHLQGTNFQVKVWEALLSIPDGTIATYGDVAARLGDAKLSRAVGAAIGDNPVGYIIPCHRVLKSTGEISGYRWGVARKRAMLGHEAIRRSRGSDSA